MVKFWNRQCKPSEKVLTDHFVQALKRASSKEQIQTIFDSYKELAGKRFSGIIFSAIEKLTDGHMRALQEAMLTNDMDPMRKLVRKNRENLITVLDKINLRSPNTQKKFLQAVRNERIPLDEFLNSLVSTSESYKSSKVFFIAPKQATFIAEMLIEFCKNQDSLEGTKIEDFLRNVVKKLGVLPPGLRDALLEKAASSKENFNAFTLIAPTVFSIVDESTEWLEKTQTKAGSLAKQCTKIFSTKQLLELFPIIGDKYSQTIINEAENQKLNEIEEGLKKAGAVADRNWPLRYIEEFERPFRERIS